MGDTLTRLNTMSGDLNRVQSYVRGILDPVAKKEILQGQLVTDQALRVEIDNVINHGLGREPLGYIITSIRLNAEEEQQDYQSGASYTEVTAGLTNNQYNNIATLPALPAGTWDICAGMTFGGTTSNQLKVLLRAAASVFSGNTDTDHVDTLNQVGGMSTDSATVAATVTMAGWRQVLTGTIPIYWKALATTFGATPVIRGHIRALRSSDTTYDAQSENNTPDRTLILRTTQPKTIDLWVF